MATIVKPHLNPRTAYLQVALNNTLDEAYRVIQLLPRSERIIVEAGTPFIKRYGTHGIAQIYSWYSNHLNSLVPQAFNVETSSFSQLAKSFGEALAQSQSMTNVPGAHIRPYVVADLKTMDRAETEVEMVASAGASAAIALGMAPIETLDRFIEACETHGIDAMIDMMNVEYPLAVLQKLKKIPPVVILHRGVDEEAVNKEKQIPLHEIRRIKGMYNVMVSIAGGDTVREVQRAIFNDADIVVIWKSVYESSKETTDLIEGFLREIK
ncbi:hypothetical protein IPH92_04670 [Candidatus Kaiserbacteria bacterium]|nr:MAG: hypothetical protein IPH92_04670 [Candidatus Kaiserbacteria bacterium]